jgi:hypothetical protein
VILESSKFTSLFRVITQIWLALFSGRYSTAVIPIRGTWPLKSSSAVREGDLFDLIPESKKKWDW